VDSSHVHGEFLNGSNAYKLHLPPNPAVTLFWAVTAYNITDGTMPETPQLLAVDQRLLRPDLEAGRCRQGQLNRRR
jgi:Protein of unknown function (DUF1214)